MELEEEQVDSKIRRSAVCFVFGTPPSPRGREARRRLEIRISMVGGRKKGDEAGKKIRRFRGCSVVEERAGLHFPRLQELEGDFGQEHGDLGGLGLRIGKKLVQMIDSSGI
ncbi:hypothetical protein MPTK1_2g19000 [Marchantia polymorpha subsp. ruderalis]|uniref:Uncharacterized protein n=1 Tax=Marchantia polymorpha TaxID=3197 RepID=A0A2R6W8M1_MARPO|nr:hypothetical protein MARPO_0128s0015 [Marchantia polymorpha]BBN02888.1 hypothetical protein Mp_2g19000 [Marchantia polymorpha subsp. ruderalis]|eukprot:PTQ30191.1 hypothetical protein MARPO_0128s0015 [Marchantia polymorpha]